METPKTNIRFSLNNFLLYTIQDVTQKPTIDILAFFHDLSRTVAITGLEKNKGKGIRKDIEDFYPGTSIPFRMLIKGWKDYNRGVWNPHTRQYDGDMKEMFTVSVEVMFPEGSLSVPKDRMKVISEALMERELLGVAAVELPKFDKPEVRTPKMYKKMMEDICGKKEAKTVRKGFDLDEITGRCKKCNGIDPTNQGDKGTYICRCAEYDR